jgi:hypothetical protein
VNRSRLLVGVLAGLGVLLIGATGLTVSGVTSTVGLRAELTRGKLAPPLASRSPSASGSPSAPGSASPSGSAGWWHPRAGLSWQWQLSGALDTGVVADVYDIDAVTTTAAQVSTLHRLGRKAICYVNVGAYETFRPDAARFPHAVLGKELDGWPGERWLDVRRWDVLEPILADRFAACQGKGFDGVEPDNVDGYDNDTGFPLTAPEQLTFNRQVAALAHRAGLAVGLKNDVEQAASLAAVMDFAVNEECVRYRECAALRIFPAAGKPVFHAEYDRPVTVFCAVTRPLGFSSIRKRLELDAWRQTC